MRCWSLITHLGDCTVRLRSHCLFFFFILSPLCPFFMLLRDSSLILIYVLFLDVCVRVCGYFQAFTCVTFIYICSCEAYFAVSPSSVVLLLHLRILISPSWCSPLGLSCGQIAALFISLVINITRCTATFAGNNTDNGAAALLSLFFSVLFFSLPHCCGESHFCEQQAHSFISRPFGFSLIFFQTSFHLCWMVLSLAAGYRLWLPSRVAPQRLHVRWITITCCFDWTVH